MRAPAGCGVSRLRVNVCYLRQGERARIGDAHAFFFICREGGGYGRFFSVACGVFFVGSSLRRGADGARDC